MLRYRKLPELVLASKLYPTAGVGADISESNIQMNSHSQRLMIEAGVIDHVGNGFFSLLPTGVRALEKLTAIIDRRMESIGAQKVRLPSLCSRRLLENTGRWDVFGQELFRLKDRNDVEYCLAPTHEESITQLVAKHLRGQSEKLPLLLYQTTSKFRDEPNPKHGLLRCRQFLMKDLYSFDVDQNRAEITYELCTKAYEKLFESLVPSSRTFRVESESGAMGGSLSHEFHLENDCGEDQIDYCSSCRIGRNLQSIAEKSYDPRCSGCRRSMERLRTAEIGHTFLLGTKYSNALGAVLRRETAERNSDGSPLYMGCYGVGVTRLMAALVDSCIKRKFSPTEQVRQLRWPSAIAPYTVCIIPPKAKSKQAAAGVDAFALNVAESLISDRTLQLSGEVVFDDRTDETVGRRLVDAKRQGYPFVIVVNKHAMETVPKLEVYQLNAFADDETPMYWTHQQLFEMLRNSLDS